MAGRHEGDDEGSVPARGTTPVVRRRPGASQQERATAAPGLMLDVGSTANANTEVAVAASNPVVRVPGVRLGYAFSSPRGTIGVRSLDTIRYGASGILARSPAQKKERPRARKVCRRSGARRGTARQIPR